MRYHLFQKFFGKMVEIKETSFLFNRGMILMFGNCITFRLDFWYFWKVFHSFWPSLSCYFWLCSSYWSILNYFFKSSIQFTNRRYFYRCLHQPFKSISGCFGKFPAGTWRCLFSNPSLLNNWKCI